MRACLVVLLCAACGGRRTARRDAAAAVAPPRPADAAIARALPDAAAPPAERIEHVAWRLVDNRHAAHREVGGEVVLDAGDLGFARFTRFGLPAPRWHLGHTVDGTRVAIADRLAPLEVPLSADQAGATQITARVHADARGAIAVKIHGRAAGRIARVALDPGWQTIALPVARGRFAAGENELVLETRGKVHAAFAWLRVGTSHPRGDDDPLAAASFDPAGDALELAEGAQLAWYVAVPDGANLVGDVAGPCRVEVAARTGDGTLAGGLLGGGARRVDLTPVAGRVVRLALTARDCPRARVVHPAITLHGPDPVPLPRAEPPRFVIVWLAAALPADPDARATPAFAELARGGATFTAYGQPDLDRELAALAHEVTAAGYVQIRVTSGAVADVVDAALAQLDHHRDHPTYVLLAPSTSPEACARPGDEDRALARLVQQLRAWGLWDHTLLAVTANAGRCGGADPLADAALRVPLVIHDPARFPAGLADDDGAAARELVPTIVAALGRPPVAELPGVPLESLAQGAARGWPRPMLAAEAGAFALRVGSWKLRVAGGGLPWLSDLAHDPGETRDVSAARPVERRMLTDQLGLTLALRGAWQARTWGVTTAVTADGAAALDGASTP